MKTLTSLMREFAILGMEPEPLEGEAGLEFDPQGATLPPEEELEFELDADGNIVLDADGNPVPKAALGATAPETCTCDHKEGDLAAAAQPPTGGVLPPLPDGQLGQFTGQLPPPEDEFDFKF